MVVPKTIGSTHPNRRMHKLSLTVIVAMMFLACSIIVISSQDSSEADSGTCGDNLTWTLENETLTISGTGPMRDFTELSMPTWNNWNRSITNVVIEEGVTSIGSKAFFKNDSILTVRLPESLTSIGTEAFYQCDSIFEVLNYSNLPITKGSSDYGGIARYAKNVVWSVDDLSINVLDGKFMYGSSGTDYYLLRYVGSESSVTLPSTINGRGYEIYKYAFYGNKTVSSVVVPNGVTAIGDYAFSGCNSLSLIDLPEGITTIGRSAFSGCALATLTIPEGVTSITNYVFSGCKALTTINLPSTLTSIGGSSIVNGNVIIHRYDEVFNGCSLLTAVNVSEDNTSFSSLDGVLYNKKGTDLLYYPHGKTANTFAIPSGVTDIGSYAFSGRTALESVTVPNTVTTIGVGAFAGCKSLTSAPIGNHTTIIWDYAFSGCESLTSVILPDYVAHLRPSSFSSCTSLETVSFGKDLTTIGENAFYGCTSLSEFIVSEGNSKYSSSEGVLFNKSGNTLVKYPLGKTGSVYTIPDSVTTIEERAFYYCTQLESVTLPDGLTTIKPYAFSHCSSVKNIAMPDSVSSIGDQAFSYCSSLTTVNVPNGVSTLNRATFAQCPSITTIAIPGSITSIGDYVFEGCYSLFEVVNRSSLTFTIGSFDNGYVATYAKRIIRSSGDSTVSTSDDGYVYGTNEGKTYLIRYLGNDITVTLPDLINGERYEICEFAFYGTSAKTVNYACDFTLTIANCAFYDGKQGTRGITFTSVHEIAHHQAKAATCTENGNNEYDACERCDYSTCVIIPATGHSYSATYEWSDDGKACIVHIVCANDGDHNRDLPVAATSSVKVPARYSSIGTTEYKVSGTYDGFQYSSTKDVDDIEYVPKDEGGIKTYESDISSGVESNVKDIFEDAKEAKGAVTLSTGNLVITFDSDAVNAIGGNDVSIKATLIDNASEVAGSELVVKVDLSGATFADGKAKVTIPFTDSVPKGKEVKVYYINGDNKEAVDSTFSNNSIVFETNHFSTYAVFIEDTPSSEFPMTYVLIGCFAVLAVGVIAIVVRKYI